MKSQGRPPRRPGCSQAGRGTARRGSPARPSRWARRDRSVTSGAHGPRPTRAASQAMTAAPSPTRMARPPATRSRAGSRAGCRQRRAPRPAHRCPRRWPPTGGGRQQADDEEGRADDDRPHDGQAELGLRDRQRPAHHGRRQQAREQQHQQQEDPVAGRVVHGRGADGHGAQHRRQGDHAQQRDDAPQAGAQQHEQHEAADGIEGHPLGGQRQTERDAGARPGGRRRSRDAGAPRYSGAKSSAARTRNVVT